MNLTRTIFVVFWLISLSQVALSGQERELQWSDRAWIVKSAGVQGPGPNAWSASKESVWVDQQGHLHLKIRYDGQRWLCAEIRSKEPTEFGRYQCSVQSNMMALDKNMVFGFFAYADDQHEVDVEYSAWGIDQKAMEQFVVQPYNKKGHLQKFDYDGAGTHYLFQWTRKDIYGSIIAKNGKKKNWAFKGGAIPSAQNAYMHINLWLFKGAAPKKECEVVISHASFVSSNIENTKEP